MQLSKLKIRSQNQSLTEIMKNRRKIEPGINEKLSKLHIAFAIFLGIFLCRFVTVKEDKNLTHYSILLSTHDHITFMFKNLNKLLELYKGFGQIYYRVASKILDQELTLKYIERIRLTL